MSPISRRGKEPPPVTRPNDSLNRFKRGVRIKGSTAIEVLHSPPLKTPIPKEKKVANRSCFVSPKKVDFGQYYTGGSHKISKDAVSGPAEEQNARDQLQILLKDQYNFEPRISPISNMQELKKHSRHTSKEAKRSSHRGSPQNVNSHKLKAGFDESHWQKLNSVEDIDTFIKNSVSGSGLSPEHIFISDVPLVKVIAEKFSKYKRGNFELRRLDEKVVCVEYDIFNQPVNHEVLKPVQRMRAFFSIKPCDNDSSEKQGLQRLSPIVRNEFGVLEEDLEKLIDKEIEFIDCKIKENKCYLEDLRRILKRKEVVNVKKNKTALNLHSLYAMARKDKRRLISDFSRTNIFSKSALEEVKHLILQQCSSSVQGIGRRTIKKNIPPLGPGAISDNIMSELL